MDVQLSLIQNNLIKDIAVKEGFIDFELETKSGSVKGDGYLGVIITVNIKNGNKKLDLILKSALSNEKLRKRSPIRGAYLREIYLYETIFPKFDEFQRENGLFDGFSGTAKFYGSCDGESNECLVLENLKSNDYELWNRKIPMNSEHVALVMAEYGKFHAVSLAMSSKKPTEFKALTENLDNLFKNADKSELSISLNYAVQNGLKAVKGNSLATEAMERFAGKLEDFFNIDLETQEDQLVVTHGDCWCNNMMFKYEDPQDKLKPTKVCLLDWQLAKMGSPALDLAYFFFVCSPKEILTDFERYLKIYHDSVSDSLRKLSCDVDTIFPYILLEHHWKKYCSYGLFIAIMIIKVMLSETHEVLDLAEYADAGKGFFDNNSEIARVNDFNQRIVDIVTVLVENKLI